MFFYDGSNEPLPFTGSLTYLINDQGLPSRVFFPGSPYDRETEYEYDSDGQLLREVSFYPQTRSYDSVIRETTYHYDEMKNPKTVPSIGLGKFSDAIYSTFNPQYSIRKNNIVSIEVKEFLLRENRTIEWAPQILNYSYLDCYPDAYSYECF
ncbi:MAG: hypothetical protein HRT61_22290 [Ekhidna sp.]|nr:hypothetical protein [Ekhidna sp.]